MKGHSIAGTSEYGKKIKEDTLYKLVAGKFVAI